MSDSDNENDGFDEIWQVFCDKFSSSSQNIEEKYQDNGQCIHCKSYNILIDNNKGYLVCSDCGNINETVLDRNPEWTNNDDGKSDSVARCGAPINYFLPKSSLGTTIVGPGLGRIKRLQNWGTMPYKERSMLDVIQNIESKCKKFGITKAVIDNAKIFYKKITDIKHNNGNNEGKNIIIRGMNRKSIIAACVYYGADKQGFPYGPKDIAEIFDLKLTQITKGIRHLETMLQNDPIIKNMSCPEPSKFVKSYYNKLKIKQDYVPIAIKIANNIVKLDLASNHQPICIAAGSILLMCKMHNLSITKKEIADVFSISEVTINKIYNKIKDIGEILIDDDKINELCQEFLNDVHI